MPKTRSPATSNTIGCSSRARARSVALSRQGIEPLHRQARERLALPRGVREHLVARLLVDTRRRDVHAARRERVDQALMRRGEPAALLDLREAHGLAARSERGLQRALARTVHERAIEVVAEHVDAAFALDALERLLDRRVGLLAAGDARVEQRAQLLAEEVGARARR